MRKHTLNPPIARALLPTPLFALSFHSLLFSILYISYIMAHQNPFHDPPYPQDHGYAQPSPRPGAGLGYPPNNQARRGSYLDPHQADLGYRPTDDWRAEEEDELKPLNS